VYPAAPSWERLIKIIDIRHRTARLSSVAQYSVTCQGNVWLDMMEQITQQYSSAEHSIARYLMVESCSQAQSYIAQYSAVMYARVLPLYLSTQYVRGASLVPLPALTPWQEPFARFTR
jgi:hypothetical protein